MGFAGEVKVWAFESGRWVGLGEVDTRRVGTGKAKAKERQAGEVWAVALSADGRYLVGTTYDGRINVWDLDAREGNEGMVGAKMQEMSTKGSFGMCVDLVGGCSLPGGLY